MNIESNLNQRIADLEDTLRMIRDDCAFNLESPGNEDDTLNSVIDSVTSTLRDKYVFDMDKYLV